MTNAVRSLNPNGEQQGDVATANLAPADAAPTPGARSGCPGPGWWRSAQCAGRAVELRLQMASGSTYSPTGSVPVTFSGGQARPASTWPLAS